MCEKGGMGGYGGQSGNRIPQDRSQQKHIFANRKGHLPDTPRNRQIVMELINDPKSMVGTDSRGNTWYASTGRDGSQLWASVRNGVLQNAGKNEKAREWDDRTGLSGNPFRNRRRKQ